MSRVPPWIFVVALAAALAAAMSGGGLHRFQGSDSIVPVLVSLQRWAPFYWQQDRFGMLVPLIVMPLRNPLLNLAAQGWIMATAALLAPFLVARLLLHDVDVTRAGAPPAATGTITTSADALQHDWIAAGALADMLLLLLVDDFIRFDWLVVQPYALSVSLAAVGLIAADRPGLTARPAAVVLMLLAHWVNVGIVVLAVPLAVLRRRSRIASLAVTGFAAAGGIALTRLSPYHTTTALLPPAMWPHAWIELLIRAQQVFPNRSALVVTAAGAGAAAIALIRSGRRNRRDRCRVAAAALALCVAMVYWLVAGTSRWVQLNIFLPRYIYSSLLMCGVAAGCIGAGVLRAVRSVFVPAALALCALTLFDYGVPSGRRLAAVVDARLGALTPDIVSSGATVVGGNYWTVWPAVFHANLRLYRSRGPAVYGFTYRSAPTDNLWKGRADIVLAAAAGDATIVVQARRAGLTISRIRRYGTIDLYAVRTATPEAIK